MTRKRKRHPEHVVQKAKLDGAVQKAPKGKRLSALQQKMKKQMDAARFRMLNESMYTTTGAKSKSMMEDSPELFHVYHAGYSEQVKRWPWNPLDDIIAYLKSQKSNLRVADLGCGEARLAREVPQPVKSFDLVAANESVTACDISSLPLQDSSVDVAVFCLSLMGTNYGDFLREARRVLVPKGLVLVAEVASRFPNHDPRSFVDGVKRIGFRAMDSHPLAVQVRVDNPQSKRGKGRRKRKGVGHDLENGENGNAAFFYKFVFSSTKSAKIENDTGLPGSSLPSLRACVYKKR